MKSILITGGTGSFGQAFVKHLLRNTDIERVVVFSRGEHAQAAMHQYFAERPEVYFNAMDRLRFFIGDVRDVGRLHRAFIGTEAVVHAAALKRIEVGHYNPDEMVKTNVLGTMNVIQAAELSGVRRVVGISSDKAWQPVSAYGQSKALAETLLMSANNSVNRDSGPKFLVVRYGNVAGSAGSVIPKWREMLKSTKVLPVTDPDCTRFWMFMDEAVGLVYDTIMNGQVGKVIIPSLPAYRLFDLAAAMGATDIRVNGLPAWEKKHEGMDFDNTSDTARRMSVAELREALQRV